MKIKKRNIFLAVLTVVAIAVTGITVDAVVTKTPQPPQQTSFIAEITFQLWEDGGCGCVPIRDAIIIASGGEGSDENVTNEGGNCVLTLEINAEYTVLIDAEGYQSIKFEFLTVDDQYFAFHLSEIDESSREIKINSIVSNVKGEILKEKEMSVE